MSFHDILQAYFTCEWSIAFFMLFWAILWQRFNRCNGIESLHEGVIFVWLTNMTSFLHFHNTMFCAFRKVTTVRRLTNNAQFIIDKYFMAFWGHNSYRFNAVRHTFVSLWSSTSITRKPRTSWLVVFIMSRGGLLEAWLQVELLFMCRWAAEEVDQHNLKAETAMLKQEKYRKYIDWEEH